VHINKAPKDRTMLTPMVLSVQVYARAVRIAASLGGFIALVGRDYALGQLDAKMADR
jgi:hypothetical protein